MPEPAKKAAPPRKAAAKQAPPRQPLPDTKPELAALAIARGVPSYEAWDLTVDELKAKLEAPRG